MGCDIRLTKERSASSLFQEEAAWMNDRMSTKSPNEPQIVLLPETHGREARILDNTKTWVAVIGAGAACAEFVKAFSEIVISRGKESSFGFVVIDPRNEDEDGRGVAWTSSQNTELRANMHIDSIARGSETVNRAFDGQFSPEHLDGQMFKKRIEIGERLSEQFRRTKVYLKEAGVSYLRIVAEAKDIARKGKLLEVTHGAGSVAVDTVVLAMGHIPPTTYQHLADEPQFIANPWKWHLLEKIPKSDSVGIIGMGPTAVDVALTLKEHGHEGRIEAYSTSGLMQYPRCRYERYQPTVFTEDTVRDLVQLHKEITLEMIAALIVSEFRHAGVSFDGFKAAIRNSKLSPIESLPLGIAASSRKEKWFSILKSFDDVTAICWHYMSAKTRAEYKSNWRKYHTNISYGMASVQAAKIHLMIQDGQLATFKGSPTIVRNSGEFQLATPGMANRFSQWIINCSGVGTDIKSSRVELFNRMVASGMFSAHPDGGVLCDFDSGQLIDESGDPTERIFTLVGSLNYGTRLLTHCYAEVVKSAQRTAVAILQAH